MTPYMQRYVSETEVHLFERIRTAVRKMPDLDVGTDQGGRQVLLSCHVLARAVARVFSLHFVDGFFHPNYEHSWVRTPEGHIIDVYPLGIIGGPILIECKTGSSPLQKQYLKASRHCYRGRFGKKEFRQAVNRIAKELIKTTAI